MPAPGWYRSATVTDRLTPLDIETKLFRGLADPARLRLLSLLRGGPRAAGELAAAAELTPSNASNHLRCLLECGLVRVEPEGRRNVYRLSDGLVARLLDASSELLGEVGGLIEACQSYGPPTRRRSPTPATTTAPRDEVRIGPVGGPDARAARVATRVPRCVRRPVPPGR